MTRRIFNTVFFTTMLTLVLSIVVFVSIIHRSFEQQVFEDLSDEAVFIAQGIEQNGCEYFSGLNSKSRITYIAEDGTVIYDNWTYYATMDNHATRDEVIEARETGTGTSKRYSDTISVTTLYFALELNDGTILRVASEQSTVLARILSLMPPIFALVIIMVLLSILSSKKLSGRITKPILDLDLEHPENSDVYEELIPLLLKIHHQNKQIDAQIAQLKRNQEEFATITENMSEGFLLVDDKTNLLSYNSSALKLLSAQKAKSGESVLVLERGSSFRQVLDLALEGQRSDALMNIGERCHQLYASPVFEEGNVVGAVIAIIDVTERENRERLRREFTANVSHELKTPLTSISGFAEIMKNQLVPPEAIPEFAGDIFDEAQRLITLVNDILHLSRMDEGKQQASEQIELKPLCESVLSRLAPLTKQQNIKISVEGDNPSISTEPQMLDEIIHNITENAIKYNRPDGEVSLKISETCQTITLEICDTGIGIPPDERERVFERFYRVDKSHSKEIGGTGLGLSIVKHGCVSLGIKLELSSEYGKGSCFKLTWDK